MFNYETDGDNFDKSDMGTKNRKSIKSKQFSMHKDF